MNSMNNNVEELAYDLKLKFNVLQLEFPMKNQVAIDLEEKEIHSTLSYVKAIGWKQLTLLTCVDWIEENTFQLVYILFNWENGVTLQVRTKINREKPDFRTITNIFPGAQYYERDVHEFFGVNFEGNPMSYKPLFLELWKDIPPLRKDFDTQKFSDENFPKREYKGEFRPKVGEN